MAKTADGHHVLATVTWRYRPGLCYLTLDDHAVQALRANPPPVPWAGDLPIPPHPHSRIATALSDFCYLQADNTAICKGNENFHGKSLTGAPGGKFVSISEGSIHAC